MKKFMLGVLFAAIITMIGTIISFFVFDFSNIIMHRKDYIQKNKERINQAIPRIENPDFIHDYSIMDDLMENITTIVSNAAAMIEDGSFDLSDITFDIMDKLWDEDGYVIEENIEKYGKRRIAIQDSQNVTSVKKIEVSLKNYNVVYGRTKEDKIKLMLICNRNGNCEDDITASLSPEGIYTIAMKGNRPVQKINLNINVLILLPDQFTGGIKTEVDNGNYVGLFQTVSNQISVKNGNVVLNQKTEKDLEIAVHNGNIILDIDEYKDFEVNAEVKNGVLIGFGNNLFGKSSFIYGSGLTKVNLNCHNGNIIINNE